MGRAQPAKQPTTKQKKLIKLGEKISVKKQAEAAAAKPSTATSMTDADESPKLAQIGLKPLKSATKTAKKRFSSMRVLTGKNKATYEQRREERTAYKKMKAAEQELKEMMKEEQAEERRKALQRKLQREENEKKGLIYQKITNTRKLKSLTKNQMNSIMKMDF